MIDRNSQRWPVWPGSTHARDARACRLATLLLPIASPGFVARSQVLSGPNVQSVQRGGRREGRFCQRPSKAAQVWPSKMSHSTEVTSP